MTDDIVTRLRGQFSNEFIIDHPNMVRVPTLYEEAADEIERLQEELATALKPKDIWHDCSHCQGHDTEGEGHERVLLENRSPI